MSTCKPATLRVAVQGCCHGELDQIYQDVDIQATQLAWPSVDLLIVCGDFQAIRNRADLACMAVPQKYARLADFHAYYTGTKRAPYLTIYVGGNHEASNYHWELFHGGWVAQNIYYLGAANVVQLAGLRIAGLSGIWKSYNYRKPHYERLPYSSSDIRSVYHQRQSDVQRLLAIQHQIDIFISHDWPTSVVWEGDWSKLFAKKPFFESEARAGTLGSPATDQLLRHLRPFYWFSAHLHTKYEATIDHVNSDNFTSSASIKNADEIVLDLTDSTRPTQKSSSPPSLTGIYNTTTKFLALDKCLPRRSHLQLLEIPRRLESSHQSATRLQYDPEWLAIVKATVHQIGVAQLSSTELDLPTTYLPLKECHDWVQQNIVNTDKLNIPLNFELTAPVHSDVEDGSADIPLREYTNNQTKAYCRLLDIPNPFHASEIERQQRIADFIPDSSPRSSSRKPPWASRRYHGHRRNYFDPRHAR